MLSLLGKDHVLCIFIFPTPSLVLNTKLGVLMKEEVSHLWFLLELKPVHNRHTNKANAFLLSRGYNQDQA